MKTEYVATCEVVKDVVWFRKFLMDLDMIPLMLELITLYYDESIVV